MVALLRPENNTNVRSDKALRAFLTPPREGRPAAERALLAVADATTVLRSGAWAWSWGDGPTTLLVHGWGGRGAQLGSLVTELVNRGRRVVAFDAPAHGDSPGATATIDAFAETAREAAAWAGGVDAVVAHSFGAAATTVALTRGLAARRVAFLAPFFRVAASVERYVAATGLDDDGRARFLAGLTDLNRGHGPDQLDGPRLAPAMTAPLLVLHDRDDREVNHADGAIAASTWPGARLVTTVGLGHRRLLDDVHVLALVADFLGGATPATFVLDDAARIDRELANRALRLRRAYPW